MTKERMGEIALTMIKTAFQEFVDEDSEDMEEEIEMVSEDTDIPKEEIKEFFEILRKKDSQEGDAE